MDRFRQPTPAEVEVYIRRARAERSGAICAFFRRLGEAFGRRSAHPAAPAKPA